MNELPHKKRRRWLSFSLRGMLVLITLLCVFLGLIGVEWMESRREEAAVMKLREAGAWICYDYQRDRNQLEADNPEVVFNESPTPYGPAAVRYLFGEHIFSRVVEIDFSYFPGNTENANQVASELPKLSKLSSLGFQNRTALSDESIEQIAKIPKLRSLYFCGGSITPAQLRYLGEHSVIEEILLEATDASDGHLAQLQFFPKLKVVSIRFAEEATNKGINMLGDIPLLESLTLQQVPKLTDEGVVGLAKLQHLRLLEAYSSPFGGIHHLTEKCLPTLSKIESLEELHLAFNRTRVEFDVAQYQGLSKLQNLKYLELNEANILDAAMPFVASLKNLRELDLADTDLTEKGLAHLKDLPNLEFLRISDTNATNETLKVLSGRLEHLKQLDIHSTQITEEGIVHLLDMPCLESLDFNFPISKVNLRKLAEKESIQRLDYWRFEEQGAEKFLLSHGFAQSQDSSTVYLRNKKPSEIVFEEISEEDHQDSPTLKKNSDDPFGTPNNNPFGNPSPSSDPFG